MSKVDFFLLWFDFFIFPEDGTESETYIVQTARGDVRCQNIVYATNAWTSALETNLSECIKPVVNTVVCTSPTEALLVQQSVCVCVCVSV